MNPCLAVSALHFKISQMPIRFPDYMEAMVFTRPQHPLILTRRVMPQPAPDQVLIKVMACGVCRTDLHIVDGELANPQLPLIPGHEIIGVVVKTGPQVVELMEGDLVGVPWLGYTCGKCKYCLRGAENLCENARFTGYTLDGGFAEYCTAYEKYCFRLTPDLAKPTSAPLMCAGLIGYRSYRMIPANALRIGLYGFGAAASILIQVANYQQKRVYAFTRDGDEAGQAFALKLGAVWAGGSSQTPPEKLDAAILFAPVGDLIPQALKQVDKGGTVICGGIHMSDIPSFPYSILWEERSIRSVANLTRKDGRDFIPFISKIPILTTVTTYPLSMANEALEDLRTGRIHGAAVLVLP